MLLSAPRTSGGRVAADDPAVHRERDVAASGPFQLFRTLIVEQESRRERAEHLGLGTVDIDRHGDDLHDAARSGQKAVPS